MRLLPCMYGLVILMQKTGFGGEWFHVDKQAIRLDFQSRGNSNDYLDECDLQLLPKPRFAERWSCDKTIENDKVPFQTKCELVCSDGYDIFKGEKFSH